MPASTRDDAQAPFHAAAWPRPGRRGQGEARAPGLAVWRAQRCVHERRPACGQQKSPSSLLPPPIPLFAAEDQRGWRHMRASSTRGPRRHLQLSPEQRHSFPRRDRGRLHASGRPQPMEGRGSPFCACDRWSLAAPGLQPRKSLAVSNRHQAGRLSKAARDAPPGAEAAGERERSRPATPVINRTWCPPSWQPVQTSPSVQPGAGRAAVAHTVVIGTASLEEGRGRLCLCVARAKLRRGVARGRGYDSAYPRAECRCDTDPGMSRTPPAAA
eukprot:356907-Chlamydomonas_euryale.AAC.7